MSDEQREETVSIPWLLTALAVWWLSVWRHDLGVKWAGQVFQWARTKGNLHPEGGLLGMQRLELGMALFFGSVALVVAGLTAYRLRRVSREQLVREAVPWATWAALLFLVWKCFIVYSTELIHFGQYATVGFLLAMALGKGRYPLPAFLLACGLGLIDEIYQHYVLATHDLWTFKDHWMDFTDPVLDALGAAGAILPFVTLARLREDETGTPPPDTYGALKAVFVVLALALVPLAFLDPVTVAEHLGSYRVYPYWGEYDNFKPTHWPGPREGVPVLLGSLLILGTLMEPRRKSLPGWAVLALIGLATLAVQPPSRKEGMPVHRRVPYAQATFLDKETIKIDGKLDEAIWQKAARLGPFVRSQDGKPAEHATYARVVYGKWAIYFAFEVEDPDVWARKDLQNDDTTMPGDEVVEVFLDVGGDELTYFEFEISPSNTLYDLFCFIPTAPEDYSHWNPFISIPNWTGKAIESAVQIDGEIDLVDKTSGRWDPKRKVGGDRGWTVELKIPYSDLIHQPWLGDRLPFPPKAGDRWRLGLFRFERVRPAVGVEEGAPVTFEEARALVGNDEWFDVIAKKVLQKLTPEQLAKAREQHPELAADTDHYDRRRVLMLKDGMQAWAPTWHPLGSTHRPYWFGELAFEPQPAEDKQE